MGGVGATTRSPLGVMFCKTSSTWFFFPHPTMPPIILLHPLLLPSVVAPVQFHCSPAECFGRRASGDLGVYPSVPNVVCSGLRGEREGGLTLSVFFALALLGF